jgi:ubiquinone/menaquinone biosynthesis C-methylase UbiE
MADTNTPYQREDLASTWDKVSAEYNEAEYWKMPENHANLQTIVDHLGDPAGKRIIEVGCGSGLTSLALAQRGAHCALLDISPVALATAAEGFARAGLPAPEQYLQDALHNTLPADSFDLVWNGGVIEHFVDEGKALLMREMVRLCKPGGLVLVLVPNRLAWQLQLRQWLQKKRGTWKYGFEDDMSPRRIRRMAVRNGYGECETYAFNPIATWRWLPRTSKILRWLGVDTLEHHMRRSPTGLITVLAIRKEGPRS